MQRSALGTEIAPTVIRRFFVFRCFLACHLLYVEIESENTKETMGDPNGKENEFGNEADPFHHGDDDCAHARQSVYDLTE
jgi:hypothetical protein